MTQILQVNFKFNVTREQLEDTASSLAQNFADVPGCLWKMWLMNEDTSEAGGLYLFADKASLETYKASPLFAAVLNHPALSGHSVKEFDVLEQVSRVTRAPLPASAAA